MKILAMHPDITEESKDLLQGYVSLLFPGATLQVVLGDQRVCVESGCSIYSHYVQNVVASLLELALYVEEGL